MTNDREHVKTPIALFTYNRPTHTDRALNSLSKCDRLNECILYIFCDGIKKPEHKEGVETTRSVVSEWAKKLNANVINRENNLGLAKSIVTGVTDLCKTYRKVIVLEDDLIVSPDFIDYMLQGLEKYQNEANVYQISGYMFPVDNPDTPDAFFLPLTTTWGWATWERAWKIFDWHPLEYEKLLADKKTKNAFDLDDSYPYSKMLKDRMNGENDSWGILWWFAVFKANGLVLYPKKSLVVNNGFDGTGTHCGNTTSNLNSMDNLEFKQLSNPLILPDKIISYSINFLRVISYLKSVNKIQNKTYMGELLNKLKAIMRN